jgi:xylulokinase
MQCVLSFDIGSSTTKVGLFTLQGKPVHIATQSYETLEPRPGFKEQDPQVWWNAVVEGTREINSHFEADDILAVGASGHIVSHVFIDGDGKPINHSIGFQDQRSLAEMGQLYHTFTREELADHLGIDLPPAPTWPLPRLLWMRKHAPDTLARARCVLQAKDYINFRLTGELASDASSNRGFVDISTGRPASNVLTKLGLPDDILPAILRPDQIMGRISSEAAKLTGLKPGLPVATGWNDLNAAVLGSGTVREGEAFNVTGTSEHLGLITSSVSRSPKLTFAPFLPGKFVLYGVTSCGGGSLHWYRKAFKREYEDLLRLAEAAPVGAASLFFLPYLEGERAPIWDPNASGAFIGIRTLHNEGHFIRAVLEGVAYGLLEILELVEDTAKLRLEPIVVTGGSARVDLWNSIKADVWGRSIVVTRNVHSAVLGAAMLAAVASKRYSSCEEASEGMRGVERRFSPVRGRSLQYRELYAYFRELYPTLRQWFAHVRENQHGKSNKGRLNDE